MRGARCALAVTSPATSSLVKTGGCAAVQSRAPARQVKANRGEDSNVEALGWRCLLDREELSSDGAPARLESR
jgi:hypothetical protein